MLTAQLIRSGVEGTVRHRVVNLSAAGACLTNPDGLRPDETVLVSIGHVENAVADMVWVHGGLCGLRFREPIDVAAARKPRPGFTPMAPARGWLAELPDPYRRAP